ncbi:retrovirus-related pol polyprotein from transposon TNT 1-94 [Tanacetum coccineum]
MHLLLLEVWFPFHDCGLGLGFIFTIASNGISVSLNGIFYFSAISVNGVFEIDMNNNVPKNNNNSIFSINKKRKLDLDSSYLWHCRLAHIGKTALQSFNREAKVKDYLSENGIVQNLTSPYTPQQNGVSERRNHTLLDMVRSMFNLTTSTVILLGFMPLEYAVWGCEAYVKRDSADKLNKDCIGDFLERDSYLKISVGEIISRDDSYGYITFCAPWRPLTSKTANALDPDKVIWHGLQWMREMKIMNVITDGLLIDCPPIQALMRTFYMEQPEGYVDPNYPQTVYANFRRAFMVLKPHHVNGINDLIFDGKSKNEEKSYMKKVPYAFGCGISLVCSSGCTKPGCAVLLKTWSVDIKQNPGKLHWVLLFLDAVWNADKMIRSLRTGYVFMSMRAETRRAEKQTLLQCMQRNLKYMAAFEVAMEAVGFRKSFLMEILSDAYNIINLFIFIVTILLAIIFAKWIPGSHEMAPVHFLRNDYHYVQRTSRDYPRIEDTGNTVWISAFPLAKDSLARGLPKLKFKKDHLCSACALGKSKKSSHQPTAKDINQEKLYLLHMDLCGPMRVESINEKKSKDEAPDAIIKCIKNIQVRLNATVRNVRTDNGTEFVNQTLREFYENVGITHQTSVARTPQQNDIVERRNQTLVEAAHTIEDLGKLNAKADIGIFVGYAPAKKGFRIYNRRTQKIMETIYATFDELTAMASEQCSSGPGL